LLGSTWTISEGMKAPMLNRETGEEISSVEGPGMLITSAYLHHFENALEKLNRCLESASFGDFQSCVSSGVASIEAYIEHRASICNSRCPAERLVDSKENKVPLDNKIDEWIPKMLGGKKLNKSGQDWEHFKRLLGVRDKLAIHVKQPSLSFSYEEIGELLNLFRSGIAGLLVNLHLLFNERIPSKIIRYAYLPDIELVTEED
ncbi:unnamed protein product, partial [marine sediment metagenome]